MGRSREVLFAIAILGAIVVGSLIALTGRYQAVTLKSYTGSEILCCVIDTWTGKVYDSDLVVERGEQKP